LFLSKGSGGVGRARLPTVKPHSLRFKLENFPQVSERRDQTVTFTMRAHPKGKTISAFRRNPHRSFIMNTTATAVRTEHQTVHSIQLTLKYIYALVPIIAGADKFTNLLTRWENYLNPHFVSLTGLSPSTFMHLVGIIEIVAGLIVFAKPRIGGAIVMLWLLAIALQLIVGGGYYDIAVRDIVLALGGALTLVRLTPYVTTAGV
jgi:uncharacterized membrane protein YphA (DoxX/SURF4 family)